MGSKIKSMPNSAGTRGAALHFSGRISSGDDRQLILSAYVTDKQGIAGREIQYLSCSVDGKAIVNYRAERDDCPADQIGELYNSVLDGSYSIRTETCCSPPNAQPAVFPVELFGKMAYNQRKTALYCRVASAGSASPGAIETQRGALRDFAARHGFSNIAEYLDNGFGGHTLDRPAFARMDADIKAVRIGAVIVRSIDRIARDCALAENWVRGLEARGVRLIATDGSYETPAFIAVALSELARGKRQKEAWL